MTEPAVENVDILIVGAGPVGMTLHLALAAGGQKSLLLDRRPRPEGSALGVRPEGHGASGSSTLGVQQAQHSDPRALALSHGARELLEQIEAWPTRAATPIETIHISQKDGFGRTLIDRSDYKLPALGYVVRYRDLAAALDARVAPEARLDGSEIADIAPAADHVAVTLRQGDATRRITARLLVHAEGTPGDDPAVKVSDYEQHAVICEIAPLGGHAKRAWERFTPDGPLALLPLGEEYSVVFTLPPDKADAIMAMDDAAFTAALQQQFGQRLRFAKPGKRSRFPLALRLRDSVVKGNEMWIGNSAQTLHPVSGQGFNLGLRDAWQLAEILLKTSVDRKEVLLQGDRKEVPLRGDRKEVPLWGESLAAYAASRHLDRQGGALFTDGIVRLFSNDIGPLKLARGLGLLALDVFPPARHFVAKRMIWGARAWP